MSPQYLALVRHGDYRQLTGAPSAFQPFPLTEQGHLHARRSANRLQQFCTQQQLSIADTIHCSSLLRAWQTADTIRQQLHGNHTLSESPQLGERCVGSVANLTADTIEQLLADDPRYAPPPSGWKSDSHYRLPFPGAESLMEAGMRVANYLNRLMDNRTLPPDTLQVVVGHGAAFRHAACHLGVLPFTQISQVSMYHDQPVFLCRDNNYRWHLAGGAWKLRQPADQAMD